MEDKETEILSRLAANHLYLAQFEPLRAIIVALRVRNPELALSILQTIVSRSGRFDNVTWSPSCSSPSLLTYLTTLELIQFDNASSIWGFDHETLRLRAEFLLLVQNLIDRLEGSTKRKLELESVNKEGEEEEEEEVSTAIEIVKERGDLLGVEEGEPKDVPVEIGVCVQVLDKVLELGVKRLKVEGANAEADDKQNEARPTTVGSVDEEELTCLSRVIGDHADAFDALCSNIQRQVGSSECYGPSLAITVRSNNDGIPALNEEEDVKCFASIQRCVQKTHLNHLKECLKNEDVNGAVSRIRFLHVERGVDEDEYRKVFQELLKIILAQKKACDGEYDVMRRRLLSVYEEALSSNSRHIVEMIQIIQDEVLAEEIEIHRGLDSHQIPLPIQRFLSYIMELKPEINLDEKTAYLTKAIFSCTRDLYHYARVSGSHVLECIMDAALSAVKRTELEEANNVLLLFPRLRPLIAAMGWDLLPGQLKERRELMQLLWISKSPELLQDASSEVKCQLEDISCVEHLCDTLCYHLDLAAFVACVNSGRSWSSNFSLLQSGKGQMVSSRVDTNSDLFVENFVLERLSVQSPLRVLFDVVPGIRFEDALELIKMQPISSSVAAERRIQDIELMHMRYALESAVLALGSMEKGVTAERDHHQVAFCHLNDLSRHLESIDNIARKVVSLWFAFWNTHYNMAAFDGEYVFDAALTQALKDDIQRRTQEQLTEMLGVEVDTVMAEYVVVMIGNKKSMAQIAHDLVDFIGDEHANQFVVWLSGMLPTLEGGSASRDLPAATEGDAEALAPPSDGTSNEPQPQESKEPAKRIISLKSVTSSTAPTEQKKVVSLSGGSGTIRTLNRSGQDMQDVLARRSQRFGVTMTPANQQREKNQKDKAKDNGDGRGTKRKADGGDAQQKRPGSGRNVSQLLGPPVNVDQAELDARDSLNSNKRKKTGRGDDRDSRGNNRNDQENQKDSDGNSRRQNRRRQDNDMDGDQPPLPPSPSGDCDRQGRSDRPGRGDRDGREPRGQYPGNFRGPPGYGGYPPPPFGYPPLHYPPYGMPPYGMGFPPHGMHQGPYMQPPMPPGPPRGYQPRGARPFQNKKWVNPNAAKPEGEAGATTGEGATAGEPADGNSNPADGTPALNAGAPAYIPRNPYFSSQMRPRFQNKTWVRQDPAKEEELSSSLPQTPPREEMEAPPQ